MTFSLTAVVHLTILSGSCLRPRFMRRHAKLRHVLCACDQRRHILDEVRIGARRDGVLVRQAGEEGVSWRNAAMKCLPYAAPN